MTKAEAIQLIKDKCIDLGLDQPAQIAYVLATVKHETMGTMMPVRECFWMSDPDNWLRIHHPDYYPYYGRGYVQLTHKTNYEKFSRITGRDLVNHPEIAMEPEVAAFILVYGFLHGTFTGLKLETFVNDEHIDFIGARKCINGTDKARTIAALAQEFLAQGVAHA
jgi:predicted chitinase